MHGQKEAILRSARTERGYITQCTDRERLDVDHGQKEAILRNVRTERGYIT